MSLGARHIAGFAAAVVLALAGVALLPAPYPEDVQVERATGVARATQSRSIEALRRTGTLDAFASRLDELPTAPVVEGLAAMVARELSSPDFRDEGRATAPIEGLFTGVDARAGLDARAAQLQRRLIAGDKPPLGEMLAVASGYREHGRERAELRWLQRSVAAHPDAAPAADRLLALLLAHSRHAEALALVRQQAETRRDDATWQRHAANLGAWLGRADVEIEALERLCTGNSGGTTADRTRLIELYAYVGEPDRALPHAMALVDGAAEVAAAEVGADAVLRSGRVDEGLALLQRAADRAASPSPWLRRLAGLARQDLRVANAVEALARAAAAEPGSDDRALEELYRRTDQPERLADLLQRRLARTPGDRALWQEVLTIRHALGQHEAAAALTMQRDLALADPERFVAELPVAERAHADALREQALSLTLGAEATSSVVGETLERLRPFLQRPGFRELAESLLVRYPGDPRAKPMRVELVDIGRTPREAERAAAALAATYPDDVALARLWVQRAMWAEALEPQVEARRRVFALAPEDRDNRHQLADLLEFVGQRQEAIAHWRELADVEGIVSPAVPRLIAALHATGEVEAAVEWLHRLARDEHATREQRLLAAEELFDRQRRDEAKVLYEAVLREAPAEPQALLRLGQLAAAAGDLRTAYGWFEQRLAVTTAAPGMVRFQLGETLWQLGENAAAAATHEQALRDLSGEAATDPEARHAVAVMLDRLGRRDESAAAYRELLAIRPRDVELALDYADLALRSGDLPAARLAVAHAEAVAPHSARAARLRSEVARRDGDADLAERALLDAKERGLGDGSLDADLAWLRLERGDWTGARAAVAAWHDEEPASAAALALDWQLRELLADFGAARGRWQRIGDERRVEAAVGGLHLFDDRHWLQAEVRALDLRGRTTLTPSGEASTDFVQFDACFGVRRAANDRFALGLEASPGAPGDTALGLLASAHWQWPDRATFDLRGQWHTTWDDPAAAAALGGRRSGLDAIAHIDLGARTWVSADLGVDRLSLDDSLGGGRSDTRVRADLSAGWRFVDGDRAVASWFEPQWVPAGPDSPFLADEPDAKRPWAAEVALMWRSARVLGDSELEGAVPFVASDDQLAVALRVDRQLARCFGVAVTGHAGVDARSGGSISGVSAACTWRPSFGTEITLAGGRGTTFGRSDDSDVDELQLQVVLRW